MQAGEVMALAELLHPQIHFCHATREVDGQPGYLAKIALGCIRYRSLEWIGASVMPKGSVALLTGRLRTSMTVNAEELCLDHHAIAFWVKGKNVDDWRL